MDGGQKPAVLRIVLNCSHWALAAPAIPNTKPKADSNILLTRTMTSSLGLQRLFRACEQHQSNTYLSHDICNRFHRCPPNQVNACSHFQPDPAPHAPRAVPPGARSNTSMRPPVNPQLGYFGKLRAGALLKGDEE